MNATIRKVTGHVQVNQGGRQVNDLDKPLFGRATEVTGRTMDSIVRREFGAKAYRAGTQVLVVRGGEDLVVGFIKA